MLRRNKISKIAFLGFVSANMWILVYGSNPTYIPIVSKPLFPIWLPARPFAQFSQLHLHMLRGSGLHLSTLLRLWFSTISVPLWMERVHVPGANPPLGNKKSYKANEFERSPLRTPLSDLGAIKRIAGIRGYEIFADISIADRQL